jgi:hypothetical protein
MIKNDVGVTNPEKTQALIYQRLPGLAEITMKMEMIFLNFSGKIVPLANRCGGLYVQNTG